MDDDQPINANTSDDDSSVEEEIGSDEDHCKGSETPTSAISDATAAISDADAQEQLYREVLPDPSLEQRKIMEAIHANHCVTVRACAGSGKTTCMLQVAASLPPSRRVLIITYNRSLADECKERIQRLSLGDCVKCYTIHGLVSRYAGRACNDDKKLADQLDWWDSGLGFANTLKLDIVMVDEAQDLRPLFHRALSRIFSDTHGGGIQLCLVGDPKQLLYDWATFGADKASDSFFLQPEKYWGQFTEHRKWVHLPLSVSYRLTPNIASFCNLFWGTSMIGGNTTSPNIPVEYIIKNPYPDTYKFDHHKLQTSTLAKIIDQHGPENVLFMAQSIKNERSPIRVHVNQLMKIKDATTGLQKYNFDIKESARGFEGAHDWTNKVRVWTFCGSKGCEADAVVVFGFEIYSRPHPLNQIGVALSRARKRLLVIHGKRGRDHVTNPYYPVLGDCPTGMKRHTVRFGENNSEEINVKVPAIEKQCDSVLSSDSSSEDSEGLWAKRSKLTKMALAKLAKGGVIKLNNSSGSSDSMMPETKDPEQKEVNQVYIASEFNYFSAYNETRFLQYGRWKKIDPFNEYETENSSSTIEETRIDYEANIRFASTREDVSALYGEAVTYMLQWEICRFVPNIETVVSNGILRLHPYKSYSEENIREYLGNMGCEELTAKDNEMLVQEFAGAEGKIKGNVLIPFLNTRVFIKKKREFVVEGDLINEIVFPVKAAERKGDDDNDHLTEFLPQIKSIYEIEASSKKPYHWVYLANAVMAFCNYHEKFRQIGTDPNSYESWVDSEALLSGLERLQYVMELISPSMNDNCNGSDFDGGDEGDNNCGVGGDSDDEVDDDRCDGDEEGDGDSGNDNDIENGNNSTVGVSAGALEGTCSFESEVSIDFAPHDCITERNNSRTIVGITGVCDWINENVRRCATKEGVEDVDLLEIKFVHHLSNAHRLQVLLYSAMYALEVNKMNYHNGSDDKDGSRTEKNQVEGNSGRCRGMLYNARTNETEICSIQARDAMDFLLDISQYKYNGKDRKDVQQDQIHTMLKKGIKGRDLFFAPNSGVPSSHKRKMPNRRLEQNTSKSYNATLRVDDDGDDESKTSVQETKSNSIGRPRSGRSNSIGSPRSIRSPRTYRLKKRPKKIPTVTPPSVDTDDDSIVLD